MTMPERETTGGGSSAARVSAPLPPIRGAASADLLPVIVTDTREQTPLPFSRLRTIRAGLLTADYSVAGLESVFAIERKSVADLVSCCAGSNRERFENELHRLRGFRFKRLLVIGTREEIEAHRYRSAILPAAVLGTLAAFEVRYDVPVVFEASPKAGAVRVETWAWYAARERLQEVNAMLLGMRLEATPAGVKAPA
jgi:ERCC4-type nuclease